MPEEDRIVSTDIPQTPEQLCPFVVANGLLLGKVIDLLQQTEDRKVVEGAVPEFVTDIDHEGRHHWFRALSIAQGVTGDWRQLRDSTSGEAD